MNTSGKTLLAIIPARSGSKGLKDKNIRPLKGKPLVAYTIQAAILSELFDTIHVSTDSEKYAEIASAYGADEPFLRDPVNSGDKSSSWDVVREVLNKYAARGKHFDYCILLQPTSPLRDENDIRRAYDLFVEKEAESVTSVTEVEHPVQWCFRMDESFSLKEFSDSPYKYSRRQDLEKYYRENGAIYIVDARKILDPSYDLYSSNSYAYIMDKCRSIDIDDIQDFAVAEVTLNLLEEEN